MGSAKTNLDNNLGSMRLATTLGGIVVNLNATELKTMSTEQTQRNLLNSGKSLKLMKCKLQIMTFSHFKIMSHSKNS